MSDKLYTDYRNAFKREAFPYAYVDLDLLDKNIASIRERATSKKIRIASKSVRCIHLLRYLLEANEQFQGLMCFTGDEAVWLSEQGFDDLLIAYPIWETAEIHAICAEVKKGKKIICMVDLPEHVTRLNVVAAQEGVVLPICMDLDMSSKFPGLHFGVLRSSINDVETALAFYEFIQQSKNVELNSLMGYEAQIAGVGDRMPGQFLKNIAIHFLKKRSAKKIAKRRTAVVRALTKAGAKLEIVNGGGTGSIETTRQEALVTEITVGSGFYSSHLFDYYSNFKHLPAAGYAIQVVRQPEKDIFTCHGGGYIASGAVGKEKLPLPYLPQGAKLSSNEGAGEVQTPISYKGHGTLQIGDPVFLRHSKAGELCERFNTLILLRNHEIEQKVNTYRGDGKAFL